MKIGVQIPAPNSGRWEDAAAELAVGVSFLDRPGGQKIGEVVAAYVVEGVLLLEVEIEAADVDAKWYDLPDGATSALAEKS